MRDNTRFVPALTFLLCTATWVASAPPVQGQEPPAEDSAGEIPDRRRLLTLRDGSVQRARSRRQGDAWQVRKGRDWLPLEQDVVHHRLVTEALAEADTLRRTLKKGDHVKRAELARWMGVPATKE